MLASGLFDLEWYRLANPYVVRDQIDPLSHFLRHGGELRLSPSRAFDTSRYLEEHAGARESRLNPLVHYLKEGRAQGLETHPAPPSEADRILASGLFDADWYLERYPDVAAAGYPPLLHFMVHGALEGRSPGPDFDSEWYLLRYPDVAGINPLLHYVDHGLDEGRVPLRPSRAIEVAQETVESVEDLDPELYGADYFAEPERIDVVDGRPRHRVARAFEAIVERIAEPPRAIVFLPWLVHGGADLVACHAVRALAEAHGAEGVLVVLTDHDRNEAPHLLPDGVPLLSFSQIDSALLRHERAELVDLLVRSLRPDAVLNVNSQAAWEAVRRHGRRLTSFSRLYAMLFCPDFAPDGRRSGYADTYLRDCLPFLAGVYFDNAAFIEEVTGQFGIPQDLRRRLVLLYQPASPAAASRRAKREAAGPPRVLWAGRLMPQKNVDLLIRIAEEAPDLEFHVWGRGSHALERRLATLSQDAENLFFHGPFERFDALPLSGYDAFLYTSRWDGIPNVLLEAAAAGLPTVASHVGGIGELVDGETGWLIEALDDPAPYIRALRAIAADRQAARDRVASMWKRLEENHNWQRYRAVLAREPLATGGLLNAQAIDNGGPERPSRGNARKAVARKPQAQRSARRKGGVRN